MKTILCVDDDPRAIRMVGRLLKGKPFNLVSVTDPTQVEEALKTHAIDLILLDVQMPQKSGLEVFDELKAACGDYPILFLTGYPAAFYLDEPEKITRWKTGFVDGRTDILYKPYEARDLYDKIESLIQKENPVTP